MFKVSNIVSIRKEDFGSVLMCHPRQYTATLALALNQGCRLLSTLVRLSIPPTEACFQLPANQMLGSLFPSTDSPVLITKYVHLVPEGEVKLRKTSRASVKNGPPETLQPAASKLGTPCLTSLSRTHPQPVIIVNMAPKNKSGDKGKGKDTATEKGGGKQKGAQR